MENIEQLSIGELVAKDYRTAGVFKKYGIDFCCDGSRTLEQASGQSVETLEQVKKELYHIMESPEQSGNASAQFVSLPLDLLADYIEKKHHRYVTMQIPVLENYLDKLVSVHGDRHPELFQIRSLFSECAGDITVHMKKEELMLFPFIRKMVQSRQSGSQTPSAVFGKVQNPVHQMMRDHDAEGKRFRQIRQYSGDYRAPADACTAYRLTYDLLQAFENDLHQHIHLENNILFPKAIELEKELTA